MKSTTMCGSLAVKTVKELDSGRARRGTAQETGKRQTTMALCTSFVLKVN